MKAKILSLLFAISVIAVIIISAEGSSEIGIIKKDEISSSSDYFNSYRFILEGKADMPKELVFQGCKIVHKLRDGISIECKRDINIPEARKSRIFRITDLEADMQIMAYDVWQEGYKGDGVTVVVLDTGIDSSHSELASHIAGCKNFVSGESCDDYNGHGTHVAGIITADGIKYVDGNKATGASPNALVYMLKVCGSDGFCLEDDMMAAMEYAVNNIDAKIMSISIGGGNFGSHCDYDPLAAKVNWVSDNGYLVVVASGNEGSGVSSPACASKAIAVGAVDKDGVLQDWSNRGSALDIVAPGASILSTYSCTAAGDCSKEWYAYSSGTSMAAPHVSAVAALLLNANPLATASDIRNALLSNADPATCIECRLRFGGRCFFYSERTCKSEEAGSGIVNAYKAYQYIKETAPECSADSDCDDGLFCNGQESCINGACVSGNEPDCSFLDSQCSYGVCDESSKSCVSKPRPNGTACDDGLFCTVGDACSGGACIGSARACDDGNECTSDFCDEESDACIFQNLPDGTSCDDGLFCTVNDACVSGICAGNNRTCDDGISCTNDFCDEETDSCSYVPDNSLCDDGVYCNGEEICDPQAGCIAGNAPICDDSNECTTDSCGYSEDMCIYSPVPDETPCSDGICCSGSCSQPACSTDSDCDDGNACTADICENAGTCNAQCSYEEITVCISGDGCCPSGCTYSEDTDCERKSVVCWEGRNRFVSSSPQQLSKFCKCASGEYGYTRYSGSWGWRAYKYIDASNNEIWDVKQATEFYPAYRVKCPDGKWYYASSTHYYP